MKISGVEWIGEIPTNWDVMPIGKLYKLRNEKVSDMDFEPLSVTKQGIVPQLENVAKSNNHNDRKKVLAGDFVINSRSDRKMSSGTSIYDGSVSLINIVLKSKRMVPEFTHYLLKNYGFAEEFYRWGSGIVADLWSTRFEQMKKIYVPAPNASEQQKIASFLDEKVAHIDSILEDTKKSIEYLKTYKQSLITEIVTKGLNANVEMKDSGIEWIGEIPGHWKVVPLKYVSTINDENLSNSTPKSYSFKYIDIGSVSLENGIETMEETNFKSAPSRARRKVRKNDIIISTVRTYLKAIALVSDSDDIIVSTGFAVIRPAQHCVNPLFLSYTLKSDYFTEKVRAHSYGIAYPSITSSEITKMKIVLPPLGEQSYLAEYIDEKVYQIDSLMKEKEQLIKNFESYKKSLIYEYVTGKKEVQ